MMSVRTIIKEHCDAIQEIIREEADHWKEIHAVMDQYVKQKRQRERKRCFDFIERHLLNPGDIRSRNNFPKIVQKSPATNIATIEEEESDGKQHVSKLLVTKTKKFFTR